MRKKENRQHAAFAAEGHGEAMMRKTAVRLVANLAAPVAVLALPIGVSAQTTLNNAVSRLLDVSSPGMGHSFNNPHMGWVYIRVPKPGPSQNLPNAIIDGQTVALKAVGNHLEAMYYTSGGQHTIGVAGNGNTVSRLEVRSVGDLTYAEYGLNPNVAETGVYTWDYLRKNILDNYNGIVSLPTTTANGKSIFEAEIKEWTDEGKRWYTLDPLPYSATTVQQAYDYYTTRLGMTHPLMSGSWSDEYGVGFKEGMDMGDRYVFLDQALAQMKANPQFSNRQFFAYGPNQLWPAADYQSMFPFVQTMNQLDYRFAVEQYYVEARSTSGNVIATTDDVYQKVMSPSWEAQTRQSWESASAGSASKRVVAVGLLSQPEESLDIYPQHNYNVFLDTQARFLASDPAFVGVQGIQGYLSQYAGEEQTRLMADLTRHYFIEGRKDPMLKDPYLLTHLKNPDFENGTTDWTLSPAAAGSIASQNAPGFGTLQGRFHQPAGLGDTTIWTKRNSADSNEFSQNILDLIPGRLYSLRFFTGDYQDLINGRSISKQHAVSIDIDGGETLDDKSFDARNKSNYGHPYGPFNIGNPYWMNYHQRVFKATEETGRLTLSDWASPTTAGGPIGQELIWNFMQIQPYYQSLGIKIIDDDFDNRSNGQTPVAQVGTRSAGNAKVGSSLPGAPTYGAKYALIDRSANISDNLWYTLDGASITPGEKIHVEFFMDAISGVPALGLTSTATTNVQYTTNGIALLAVFADGSVRAYGGGASYADTGLDAVFGKWQLWQIDYVVGAPSFDLSVAGDTVTLAGDTFLFDSAAAGFNSLFFNTGSSSTKYLLDDVLVTLMPDSGVTPGDADLDGDVDLSDLGVLASNYGQNQNVNWLKGDFDRDGDVDLSDLGSLASHYGAGQAQAFSDFQSLVPEPATAVPMVLLVLLRRSVLLQRRKRT